MGSKTNTPITKPDPKDPTTMIVTGYIVEDTRDLGDAIKETLGRLQVQYDGLIERGINYQGKTFQIDQSSLININGAATMATVIKAVGGTWPQNFFWIANDNSRMPLDGDGMIAFGMSVGAYYTALVLTNRALKDAILALSDIRSCDAFDVSAGWPAN